MKLFRVQDYKLTASITTVRQKVLQLLPFEIRREVVDRMASSLTIHQPTDTPSTRATLTSTHGENPFHLSDSTFHKASMADASYKSDHSYKDDRSYKVDHSYKGEKTYKKENLYKGENTYEGEIENYYKSSLYPYRSTTEKWSVSESKCSRTCGVPCDCSHCIDTQSKVSNSRSKTHHSQLCTPGRDDYFDAAASQRQALFSRNSLNQRSSCMAHPRKLEESDNDPYNRKITARNYTTIRQKTRI